MQDYNSTVKPSDSPSEGFSETVNRSSNPSSVVGIYEKPKRSMAPTIMIAAIVILFIIIMALVFFVL